MKEGDLVVLYEGYNAMDQLTIRRGATFNNRFGTFHHKDFIGKPFGSKIYSHNKQTWIYALQLTTDLWNFATQTRTQIVDELDSSVVSLALDLYPGCIVVESGTGSGCMTLAMAKCISPSGQVYTYEYNATRATAAAEMFQKYVSRKSIVINLSYEYRLNVGHLITARCMDMCEPLPVDTVTGQPVAFHDANSVDAVFLDLPEPWLALDKALHILKPGRGICCYSPCIEQVKVLGLPLRSS